MSTADLEAVLRRLRLGEHYSLCGSTLTIGDVSIAITEAEFDAIWDTLDEIEADDFTVRLPA